MVEWWLCAHREMCDVLAKMGVEVGGCTGCEREKGTLVGTDKRYLFETGEAGLGAP